MSNVETQALESLFPAPIGHDAVAYWVPIAMRERVLAAYRVAGIPIRIRFRGSRAASVGRLMPRIPASAGFYLVCSGSLQAIPGELLEAAAIDGANPRQVFRRITLQLLLS